MEGPVLEPWEMWIHSFIAITSRSTLARCVKYSLADNMGQGKNPTVPSQSDAPKRVTCELHDSYFRSMTIKHAIPKTAGVHIPLASYGKRSRWGGGVSISPRGSLMVI